MAKNNRHLVTTLKNTSGVTKSFPFLPPIGVTLAANATFSFLGPIWAIFAHSNWSKNRQIRRGFSDALVAGELTIMSHPGTFVLSGNPANAAAPLRVITPASDDTFALEVPSFQNGSDAGTGIEVF